MSDDERTAAAAATLRAVGGFLAPALLVGLALPLHRGIALPLLVVAAVVALRTVRPACSTATFASASRPVRAVLFALLFLPAVVILTVGARTVAALAIAYPAALFVVPLVLVASVLPRLRRAAVPAAVGLALLVPVAGVLGTRFEAGGEDARGSVTSGPIHGIHPGQTTALIVDGYGPFDLPVNDYVEPAGDRGYDPVAFAELVEEAMHRIAQVHFADGPARARMAFANAEAEAIVTEPVRERLDRDPGATEHPRFVVRSGTFGQRSRVEFVCPGRRDDPRGHQGENIMNRMCPTKYASEASAGLGVTGRWPGYAEFRGNERLGLSRALGWTRSDDAVGREVVAREQRLVAWIVLAVLAGLTALACLRSEPGRGDPAHGIAMLGGAVAIGALALVLALAIAGDGAAVQVGLVESPPAGASPPLWAWLPALLLLGGIPSVGADTTPAQREGEQWGVRIVAAILGVVVLLVASNLTALDFVTPQLWGERDGELALQAFVGGAAEAMGERFGLTILEVEGAIASAVVAGLVGGLAHALRAVAAAARTVAVAQTDPGRDAGRRSALLGLVGVTLAAAAVVISRKTLGGAALLPGAVGLTLVLHGGLQVLAGQGRRASVLLRLLLLWGSVGLALVFSWYGAATVDPHPFVFLCVLAGGLAALAGSALPIAVRSTRSPG